jgi:HAD superfamily hydrolase (TIGR01509 family)
MIQTLIFDFDGLILDTELPVLDAWQRIFREHGCELTIETWSECIGIPPDECDPIGFLEDALGEPVLRDEVLSKQREMEMRLIHQQPVMEGVEDYLITAEQLGLRLGIASSSPFDWVDGHLTRLGLGKYFEAVLTSDQVERAKPFPDLYLAALRALDSRPEQAVALEDSPNGVLAAKRAGIFCVAVPNSVTAQLAFPQTDLRIPALSALPLEDLLKQITDEN